MVYGGKPSTGCFLCRKRKIKCDEAFPECRNCLVYGRPCPGYRSDTIFRNETHKVERLMKRGASGSPSDGVQGQGQIQIQSQGGSPAGSTTNSSSSSSSTPPTTVSTFTGGGTAGVVGGSPLSLSLYRIEDSTWDERAVCHFFDQYAVCDQSDECISQLGFLPSLYAGCRDSGRDGPASSCFQLAVDATALMTLSNQIKAPSLILKARDRYGMALRGLREALVSRTQAVKDETFASMILLSLFEDISGERNGLASSHTRGFELLMKLRGEDQLGHAQGRDLFSFAYAHTHVEILALRERPRFDNDWIVGRLDSSDPVHRLMLIASKISQLFLEASSHSTSFDISTIQKIPEWTEAIKLLDAQLVEWSQVLPENWLPLVVHLPTGEHLLTYQRISISAIWTYYRAVRIIFLLFILDLRRALASIVGDTFMLNGIFPSDQELQEVCREIITDACRSLPFAFGDIDTLGNPIPASTEGKPRIRAFYGYIMLWPLWYILSCGMASPDQTEQIRSVLAQTGSALGIKLALTLAGEGGSNSQFIVPPILDFSRFVPAMGNLQFPATWPG